MDALLSVPLFAAFAVVAIVALVLLKRTWLFWLPGVAMMGYGVAIHMAWPWYDTRKDAGLEGLSNLLHVLFLVVVVAGGVACVIIGARSRRTALRARPPTLPTAAVIKDSGQP